MAKAHLQLLSDAKVAADKLHQDTSVDKETTKESLEDLQEHVGTLIEAVEADMENEADE